MNLNEVSIMDLTDGRNVYVLYRHSSGYRLVCGIVQGAPDTYNREVLVHLYWSEWGNVNWPKGLDSIEMESIMRRILRRELATRLQDTAAQLYRLELSDFYPNRYIYVES